MGPTITITLDELPEAWVLTVCGELDYGESAGFRLKIDKILRAMPAAIVVDLSQVTYLDSSGLGLLLSLSRGYEAEGGRLFLVTNETVDSILEITRLAGIFTIEADARTALARIREPAAPDVGTAGS